jgi:hypothetical protein
MNYTKTIEFRGNLATAFTVAVATLGAAGFSVVTKNDRTLELTGPGGLDSCRQNLWCGVSRIRFGAVGGRLELEAEFGGRRRLMFVVPALVAAIIGAGVALQFISTRPGGVQKPVGLAALVPPLVAGVIAAVAVPLAIRAQGSRTHRALDALLNNMVSMGRDS